MTIDWSLAPEWAHWWAMDYDGEAFWYEWRPRIQDRVWASSGGLVRLAPRGNPFLYKWSQSLARRQNEIQTKSAA